MAACDNIMSITCTSSSEAIANGLMHTSLYFTILGICL